MRFFAHIVLVFFIACCGIDSTENDAAKADTHKLVFDELANNRIVNGQQVKVQIEDREGEVVEEGSLASLSVTLGRKCDNEESYQNMATVDAVKGIATFTIDNSWTDGDCAVRATADGVTEAVEDGITVGAELLNIEITEKPGTLPIVKRVFSLKVKATTSDKKAYTRGSKLYLHGPSDLRQFGEAKAEATVDANGVADFNNLYFIAPVTTDIQLIVTSEDGGQSGTFALTGEIRLEQLDGTISSATFDFKEKTLALGGLNTDPSTDIRYAIRNSDHADEYKIHCTDKVTTSATNGSNAQIKKTTCLEGLKKDDLDGMFVDVLIGEAPVGEVRSTPLLVNYGN